MIPKETLAAFNRTEYRVRADGWGFTLRIGCASDELAALLADRDANCAAFITAWNPASTPTTAAENERAQAGLKAELTSSGFPFLEGEGADPSGAWPPEPSVLAIGLPLRQAKELGSRYRQDAILWCDSAGEPQLILLR
jgi:hypothetical protein